MSSPPPTRETGGRPKDPRGNPGGGSAATRERYPLPPLFQARWFQALVFLIALAAALLAHRETFQSPWVVNNDATQHTFWMHRFQQPELFPDDLLALYSENYQSWGWIALYRGLHWGLGQGAELLETSGIAGLSAPSPVDIGRGLGPLLWAFSVLLVMRVAGRAGGPRAAFFAVLLFALSPFFLQKMAGGHPRAFATPLLLLTLDRLLAGRYRQLALLLPAASLLYPMAFLLMAGTAGLSLLRWPPALSPRRIRLAHYLPPAAAIVTLLGIFLGGALLLLRHEIHWAPEIGSMVSAQEAEENPAWYRIGRANHLPTPNPLAATWETLGRALPDPRHALLSAGLTTSVPGPIPRIPLALICAGLLLAAGGIYYRRLRWAKPLSALLFASYGLYLLSWAIFPTLFLPRRYVMYSLALLAVFALAVLLDAVLQSLRPRPQRAAVGLLTLALLSTASGLDGVGLDDYGEHRELYAFAASLPQDALLAPFPTLGDGIPLFAQRSVWMTYEHSNPYFGTYWNTVQRRLGDFFTAYYAAEEDAAAQFCRRHGIDALVIWVPAFAEERIHHRRGAYFAPFSQSIVGLSHQAAARTKDKIVPGETFALDRIAPDRRLWTSSDGQTYAVACGELSPVSEQKLGP
ncbi:MAG: hypothetical protein AAGD01_09485 [Acidobacteriota bacterium]